MSTAVVGAGADPRMARRPEKLIYPGECDAMFRARKGFFMAAAKADLIPCIPTVARGGDETYLIHPDDARDYKAGRTWEPRNYR